MSTTFFIDENLEKKDKIVKDYLKEILKKTRRVLNDNI